MQNIVLSKNLQKNEFSLIIFFGQPFLVTEGGNFKNLLNISSSETFLLNNSKSMNIL